jgi:LacI family transcriptional regulator
VTICTERCPGWSTRISIDNAFGIRKAINHLASLGHREIAFIKGPDGSGDTQERWNAVLSTCKALAATPSAAIAAGGKKTSRSH